MATLEVGEARELGGRSQQQDDLLVILNLATTDQGASVHLMAVFDGHGSEGHKVVAIVKKIFPDIIKSFLPQIISDPTTGFVEAYNKVHESLLEDTTADVYMSGTTAVVALLIDDLILVSNVGDSRFVVISEENNILTATQITRDHTCDIQSELDRIKGTGARVEQLQTGDAPEGPLRIFKGSLPYPGIVVTRSIGDSVATKLGVLHEPEVHTVNLGANDRYLLLATDGLWDALSVQEAADIIAGHTDVHIAAKTLTDEGIKKLNAMNLDDNTTTVLVRLSPRPSS
eukprot:jgi/Hompol1/5490/HPOL_000192-RA